MPITSPYSPGIDRFIDSLNTTFLQVLGLEPNFLLDDLKPGKRYGLISFSGLKATNALVPSDRQNTRGSYEDRSLEFSFMLSSTASGIVAAQKEAATLLLALDHGLPFLKNFVAGEGTGIYDFQPTGDISVVCGQSEKPPYSWNLDAVGQATAPITILKDLEGAHQSSPLLEITPAPPTPPITSSPYVESISQVIGSANQQFINALSLEPYTQFNLKEGKLYGLMWVRSLRREEGRRTANGHWQKVGLSVELEIHASAKDYREASRLAGRMTADLDNVIPYIKPLVEGDSTIYDFQPTSDIRVKYSQSLKPPRPFLVSVSCAAVMPAVLQKDRMGAHTTV